MTEVSATDIKYRFDSLRHDICLEETEDNWEKISKAIQTFTLVAEKGGCECAPTEVVNAIRNFHRPLTNAMNSERTRLCGTALDMLTSMANGLGHDFDQLMPLFMPTLLNVCGRTNKVVINRARGVILSIIESTQLASILSFFVQNIKDKAPTLRLVVVEGTLACLNSCNPPDLERDARARDIETIIRGSARDANPEVRKVSRKIFESYKILLPSRVESFTAPLSPTMKKYLDIKPTMTTAKSQSLISSKSTSNLRNNSEVPDLNPVTTKGRGHVRTTSASTIAVTNAVQSKNLAAKLTRVVRKEQPGPNVRPPTMESRTASESQNANSLRPPPSSSTTTGTASGPVRTVSHNTQSKSATVPSRNPPNLASRLTSTIPITTSTNAITVAPRRLQVTSDTKTLTAQQPPAIYGARRVPIPPPAPYKEQEGHKRPPSRVDSSASTNEAAKASSTSLARPPALIKKPATIAVRKPTTKPPVPKFRPTASNADSTGTPAPTVPASSNNATKPLIINKAKPIWGRAAAPPTKAAPSATKAPAKSVVKKPSSLISKTVSTTTTQDSTSAKRPVTPAMVALPPSPAGSELKDGQDEQKEIDERNTKVDVVRQAGNMLPELSTPQQPEVNIIAEDEDADRTVHPETHTSVSVSPADSRLSTPTSEGSGPVCNAEKPSIHNSDLLGEDQATPHTPESNLLLKPQDTSSPLFSAKTPISALLSSIERGFFYSPTTPLSPADAYLPGPNGAIAYRHETHAPRVEGPMRPFNHALHAINPGETIFGRIGAMQKVDGADIALIG